MAAYTYTFVGDEIVLTVTTLAQIIADPVAVSPQDFWFDPQDYGGHDESIPEFGVVTITVSVKAFERAEVSTGEPVTITVSVHGTPLMGVGYNLNSGTPPTVTVSVLADFYVAGTNKHWVTYSEIGSLNFPTAAILAGKMTANHRPMDWTGYVYKMKKLGSSVVIYGENGVSLMSPKRVDPIETFSYQTISRIGLKSKDAAAGTDFEQIYITKDGYLYKIKAENPMPELLDYNEYLSLMSSSTVISYDRVNELYYICDGTYGFVLSKWGLGKGPANISGVDWYGGTRYIAATAAITNAAMQGGTDTLDFGSRRAKTILWLEFGTDVTEVLDARIKYRWDKSQAFQTTDWIAASVGGRVPFFVTAVEFQIEWKLNVYAYCEIDYVNVLGKFVSPLERMIR